MEPANIALNLAGVLTSGVASVAIAYRLNRNKEQSFFMRKKAEELYLAADAFGRTLSAHTITFLPLLNDQIDYNQMLDIQIGGATPKEHGGPETMMMLTQLYFPDAEAALAELLAARDAFSKLRNHHKVAYKQGIIEGAPWKPQFAQAMARIDGAIEGFKRAILVAARPYVIERSPLRGLFRRGGAPSLAVRRLA